MEHVKPLMDPIYLRDIWKSSSCLVVNTLLSITKANWLRLFIEIITLYVLLQSQDRPEYTVGKMQWSRMYVVTTALKTEIIRWSIPDIRLSFIASVTRERVKYRACNWKGTSLHSLQQDYTTDGQLWSIVPPVTTFGNIKKKSPS